ncbi:MAG: TOBE domain-containing protein, partial [Alphaproteobacteria bacterium]
NAFVAQFIGENNRLIATVEAIEGEVATVRYPSGATGKALAVNCGGPGSRTTLSIRPERVRLTAEGPNATEGEVLELIYLGDHIRCRMRVHGDENFIVKVPNAPGHRQLRVGEVTPVSWEIEDCRALDAPAEG